MWVLWNFLHSVESSSGFEKMAQNFSFFYFSEGVITFAHDLACHFFGKRKQIHFFPQPLFFPILSQKPPKSADFCFLQDLPHVKYCGHLFVKFGLHFFLHYKKFLTHFVISSLIGAIRI